MPVLAYLWKAGAALLALLFVADFFLPKAPLAEKTGEDRQTIRIHSDRKWPERIVFDTDSPVIVAAPPGLSIPKTEISSDLIGPPAPSALEPTVANAFAQLPRPDSGPREATDHKRPRKAQHAAIRPKRYVTPQMLFAARQGQLGWFGFRYW